MQASTTSAACHSPFHARRLQAAWNSHLTMHAVAAPPWPCARTQATRSFTLGSSFVCASSHSSRCSSSSGNGRSALETVGTRGRSSRCHLMAASGPLQAPVGDAEMGVSSASQLQPLPDSAVCNNSNSFNDTSNTSSNSGNTSSSSSSSGNACSSSGVGESSDEAFMRLALQQAEQAAREGEVPIGAVLVDGSGAVVASAYNQTVLRSSPLAHAEVLCIEEAAQKLDAWRLLGTTLYVTCEPCPMCAGAVYNARIKRLVYGARQPRLGADGSWIAMFPRPSDTPADTGVNPSLNPASNPGPGVGSDPGMLGVTQPRSPHPFHPNIEVTRGVLQEDCAHVLRSFFRARRKAAAARPATPAGMLSSADAVNTNVGGVSGAQGVSEHASDVAS